MNNKIALGIIALLIIGGVFLLVNNASNVKKAGYQKGTGSQTGSVTETSPSASKSAPAHDTQSAVTITVTSNGFSPDTVTVKPNTIITWINKSGKTATVNSDNHPTHLEYPPLNLGEFKNGSSVQLTFDKAGTFTYHNHVNPDQKGTVIVQ